MPYTLYCGQYTRLYVKSYSADSGHIIAANYSDRQSVCLPVVQYG